MEAFRTALRRLFLGFELVPVGCWPTSDLGGVGSPQDDGHPELDLDGYQLWPHVRADAFDLDAWAPRKTALGLDATYTAMRSAASGTSGASDGSQRAKTSLSALNAIGLLT